MGCHTWFSVPYKTDKKEIITLAQEWLNKAGHISEGHKKMYQWAIDNEVPEPVCELASFDVDGNGNIDPKEWIIYKGVTCLAAENYNKEHGTSIETYNYTEIDKLDIERYSNEPRISGYPDRVIRSYDDLVNFMSTGFDNEYGHHDFIIDEDRKERVMEGIKTFFIKHPKGVITFG